MKSPCTRKQRRFCYLLILCLLFQGQLSLAQEFDPLTPVETLVQEVADGTATITQFEDLSAFATQQKLSTDITDFLVAPNTETYLKEHFVVDGYYGETKDGLIIEDWSGIAKSMGTTGAILAGAYAVWRRREQDYLSRLRAGDASLVEDLFADESPDQIPTNTAAWEDWALGRGLPGAGVLLSGLYSVWFRRREAAKEAPTSGDQLLQEVYGSFLAPATSADFKTEVNAELSRRAYRDVAALEENYEMDNPKPVAPELGAYMSDLRNIKDIFINGIDLAALGVPAAEIPRYGTGLKRQIRSLMYFNHIDTQVIATEVERAMTNLQRALSVSWMPTWEIPFGYSDSAVKRDYYELQTALKSWLPPRNGQIEDADNLARLWEFYSESADANYEEYFAEIDEIKAFVPLEYAHRDQLRDWERGLSDAKTAIWQQYSVAGYQIDDYWQERFQLAQDDSSWQQNLSALSGISKSGEENQKQVKNAEWEKDISRLLQYFSAGEVLKLVDGSLNIAIDPAYEIPLEDKRIELEQAIVELELERDTAQNVSQFLSANYGVYQDASGDWRRNSDNGKTSVHQAWIEEYRRQYEYQIRVLENEFFDYQTQFERQQLFEIQENFAPALQTIGWLKDIDNTSTKNRLKKIKSLNAKMLAHKRERDTADHAFSVKSALQNEIDAWQAQLDDQFEQFFVQRENLLATEVVASYRSQSQIQHDSAQQDLMKNPVYKWLDRRQKNKLFYQKHGLTNRSQYLANEITRVEQLIDQAEQDGVSDIGNYNGHFWATIDKLKQDLEILRAGELPKVHWSTTYEHNRYYWGRDLPQVNDAALRELYFRYASTTDLDTQVYLQAQIETAEAALFESRSVEWEGLQTKTLETKFSAEQITKYETLLAEYNQHDQQVDQIETALAAAHATFLDQISAKNNNKSNSISENALPFAPNEVSDLSRPVTGLVLSRPELPENLQKPFWEAFRRYQDNFDDFVYEVERLIPQAQKIDRQALIQAQQIPLPPVMTKSVRDYLSDPDRTIADIDQEIADIEAGIPILHAEYAGNPYLTTALVQAENKIAALERYKANGPVAAADYQARTEAYNAEYAPVLAEIEAQLVTSYEDWEYYLSHYFSIAGDLLADRTAANAHVPTDPDLIEYVETLEEAKEREAAEKAEADAFLESIAEQNFMNPAFRNAQSEVTEAKSSLLDISTGNTQTDSEISTLHPFLQGKAAAFIKAVEAELGIQLVISEGKRSLERQADLYAQGRTVDGVIVTNAQAGESYHNYGQAFDVVGFVDGVQSYDLNWDPIGAIGKRFGFEWGGDWTNFVDRPHFQMPLGKTIAQLQSLRASGELVDGVYLDSSGERSALIATELVQGGPSDEYKRWEDPTWVSDRIKNIKDGDLDFLNFVDSPKVEKIALLEAAKDDHAFWKIFTEGDRNVDDFIEAVEENLEQEEREGSIQNFLEVTQLISALQTPVANIPLLIKFLSQESVYTEVKNLLNIYQEFIEKSFNATEEATQAFALEFQESLDNVIDNIGDIPFETNETIEGWHFEKRASLNVDLPNYDEVRLEAGWSLAAEFETKYHDDGIGEKEKKYIHTDGREAIYTFDESQQEWIIYDDPQYAGTYNYVTPISITEISIFNYKSYIRKGVGHSILDILPHKIYNGSIR